jgi:uncharacterized damage-inducible protein DinB
MRERDTVRVDRKDAPVHLLDLRFRLSPEHTMTSATQDSSIDLSYPTGRFKRPSALDADGIARAIDVIATTPRRLREAVRGLSAEQIETPYRPGGWTVRQVVHHVPDSHLNAYCRFKLGLTEDEPTIKPYDEARWALLPDVAAVPLETSLALLDAVHERWLAILRGMKPSDFERTIVHPEMGRQRLDQVLAHYAWHGPHHTAHVTKLRERMGW